MTEQEIPVGKVLTYPDGRSVTFLEQDGDILLLEHRIMKAGAMNGPHWHPELTETFSIQEGQMQFLVDGKETVLSKGETITILPNQVHQFWKIGESELVATHEIKPPGRHWQMFALTHKLEMEGKVNKKGIPLNPLWLGLAWESIDGYLAGPPKAVQRVVLGGLAKAARGLGYTF
ncbi:cupin domain-containing protein [Sutcliffiella rhizosphaerae]|uniref:Cupin type-2 domain-containing protein n=1 Tax=Sutcliffiella rhizosphaerae TaxID=2880967 RepID=A0ABN8A7R4_9BACI|nr:cupin domain-containing protein [Sutcliffiella rhizosphaerae]CAG9620441.1 hypothetical protein BACCIP111883_01209 [Sutcliffiella rhizosphaerae]